MSSLSDFRRNGRSPARAAILASLALACVAVSTTAGAQERVDVRTRSPRAEGGDVELRVRQLQLRADSLARLFEDEDISQAQRRSVADALDRTIAQVVQLLARSEDGGALSVRVTNDPEMRSLVAKLRGGGQAEAMARALGQVSTVAAPKGWMGLVLGGPGVPPRIANGELLLRYFSYPSVVSVDPGSPAQRAGLAPNDTLLAYDGRDLLDREISMTRLLRPNARVLVRFRRDGRTREVPVTVAKAPARIVIRRDALNEITIPLQMLGEGPGGGVFVHTGPEAMLAPAAPKQLWRPAPATPAAGVAPAIPGAGGFGFPASGVAGAELATLTEGFAKMSGVKQGVLVTRVPTGTPAGDAGLLSADVIVRVANQAVASVDDVRELVGSAVENGSHSVELQIVRERRTRQIVLRW